MNIMCILDTMATLPPTSIDGRNKNYPNFINIKHAISLFGIRKHELELSRKRIFGESGNISKTLSIKDYIKGSPDKSCST